MTRTNPSKLSLAWAEALENTKPYPIFDVDTTARDRVVEKYAATNFEDESLARWLAQMDALTGYSPLWSLQEMLDTYDKFGYIVLFRVNGVAHSLSWHNLESYSIDNVSIGSSRFISMPYRLFKEDADLLYAVAELADEGYPVIEILSTFTKRTSGGVSIYDLIPAGPLSKQTLLRLRYHDEPHDWFTVGAESICRLCNKSKPSGEPD